MQFWFSEARSSAICETVYCGLHPDCGRCRQKLPDLLGNCHFAARAGGTIHATSEENHARGTCGHPDVQYPPVLQCSLRVRWWGVPGGRVCCPADVALDFQPLHLANDESYVARPYCTRPKHCGGKTRPAPNPSRCPSSDSSCTLPNKNPVANCDPENEAALIYLRLFVSHLRVLSADFRVRSVYYIMKRKTKSFWHIANTYRIVSDQFRSSMGAVSLLQSASVCQNQTPVNIKLYDTPILNRKSSATIFLLNLTISR